MDDKKISWADVPVGQVGPMDDEETSPEETVAESLAVDKEEKALSDGEESDMDLDDEGIVSFNTYHNILIL